MDWEDGVPIEPVSSDASVDERDFAVTSDYDPTVDGGSEVCSVSSEVHRHCHENGRRYHVYKYGRYPIPNDEQEDCRENLRHVMVLELTDGRLHLAPLENPQRILDLGTGFGLWAIEMGDLFPSAQVTGVDLSPVQPVWVPPNVQFIVDDIEDDVWGTDSSAYDYIHLRVTACVLKDPIKVAEAALRRLKPGGWIEFQEIYPKLQCDDGTMPADYAPIRFYELLRRLLKEKAGFDLYIAERLAPELERLGYVNVQRKVFNIPLGTWAKSRRLSMAGYLLRIVLAEFVPIVAAKGAEIGVSEAEVDRLLADVRAAMEDSGRKVHAYVPFYFVWAQRPAA